MSLLDKNNKAAKNPIIKKENNCFQYCCNRRAKLWRNKKDPQRIIKTKTFINKYNWEGINFPSEKDDWEKSDKNSVTIALNVLYPKTEKIYPAYVSKHNSNREKQVILLMISNGEKQPYLTTKKPSALLRGITSEHHGDFYCLNCFDSFATENKLQSRKRAYEIKDFCNVNMFSEHTKTLEFNHVQKADQAPFTIYVHLECKIDKIYGCKNSSENLSTTKVSDHIPSDYLMPTISSFRSIENKHDVCRSKNCMKKFWEDFGEHAMKIMFF